MLASWSLWRGTPTRSVHRPERLPTGPTGWTGRAEPWGGFAPGFRSPIEMTEDSAFDRPPPTAKPLATNPRTSTDELGRVGAGADIDDWRVGHLSAGE